MSDKEAVDVMDLLDIEPTATGSGESATFGRVNITLYRKGAWHKDKATGNKIPYPDAGNYDRMIANAGCGDNPALLVQVCDKLLGMVKSGDLKRA